MADNVPRQRPQRRNESPAPRAATAQVPATQTKSSAQEAFEDIGVVFLLFACPVACNILACITNDRKLLEPTLSSVWGQIEYGGWSKTVKQMIVYPFECWMTNYSPIPFFLAFNGFALLLYKILPGKEAEGTLTDNGHMPKYPDNGLLHCFVFTAAFILFSSLPKLFIPDAYTALNESLQQISPSLSFPLYDLGIMYEIFPQLIAFLNVFGLSFCLLLYVKGLNCPNRNSSGRVADAGPSGKGFLRDYYWGTELYPRFFNVDVKQFVNCRFSMTFWQLAGISFAYKSYTERGIDPAIILCALSQFLYLLKFFQWEIGYMRSIDIIEDRAGFYETWGCLVWVPSVYTLHTRILVRGPSRCSWLEASAIFAFGILGVALNFWADKQRQTFREKFQKGEKSCIIWGKEASYVQAKYKIKLKEGVETEKTSYLLASGFWGQGRHFQYVFELMAAWSWGLLGAGGIRLTSGVLPLFYPIFLTILLVHRERRDDEKCGKKYGVYWEEYKKLVKYRMIPGLY